MDPRQPLGRATSSNFPQAPFNQTNMASYTMQNYSAPQLPPIQMSAQNHYSQVPPSNQTYMQSPYGNRPELGRYQSAPGPTAGAERYNPQVAPQHQISNLPPTSMLPNPSQPNQQPQQQQQQQQQNYGPPSTASQPYQQRLAPAPPRPNLQPLGTNFSQPDDNRPPMWTSAETVPSIPADNGRDPTRTHVVGSQGRRGILPSAPGRAAVMPNGMNGSPKGNAIPPKDADGKFPCPNCNKTYLHAKHLKRHMLRHTGDRPYMCVLCNDTFSRSDILKRHFQKCSVRRGNPTGASHLSNPAAHLKKSQAAAAKSNTDSPSSTTTPSTAGLPNGAFTSTAMSAPSVTSASTLNDAQQLPYAMQNAQPGDFQRQAQPQALHGSAPQTSVSTHSNSSWSMQNPRNSALLYNSTPASPVPYLPHNNADDKRNVMPGAHHQQMGDDWNHMFHAGGNEHYMNPMFSGYDQAHHDTKKEFEQPEGGSNGYYISSTSLGADGTLGPPLWNLHTSQEDPLQLKADRLVDFCFPGGIQESLREPQNNFHLRSCLTTESIKHFLDLFSIFQGHFPWVHVPTFDFINAYDGLILVIICIGAVYSDRVSQTQVRGLMQRTKQGVERTSTLVNNGESGSFRNHFSTSGKEFEELQALLMLQTLFIWHGGPAERAAAREESKRVFYFARQYGMLNVAGPEERTAHSYLHNLDAADSIDPSRWSWPTWVEQEKRLRVMYLVFLLDAARTIYFNCEPQFDPSEIRLPLPCDDAAWEAPTADVCAQALGLAGPGAQRSTNVSGSLRPNQRLLCHVMDALHSPEAVINPRETNVYSKFILIHALHVQIWRVQRQRSYETMTHPLGPNSTAPTVANTNAFFKSVSSALLRWKKSWDTDMKLQYPPTSNLALVPRRFGFCRDGLHFYWLARAFLQPNRIHDWQLPADARFRQAMKGLKKARDWSRSDAAERGEEPGSVGDIDDAYGVEALELDMKKLFRPIGEAYNGPVEAVSIGHIQR